MVRIVKIFTLCLVIALTSLPAFGMDTEVTKDGFYIDGRGQMGLNTIDPSHKENIPEKPHMTQLIVPHDTYYKIEYEDYRRPEGRQPLIYNYNTHASTRSENSYTKQEYIDVWCDGQQHVGNVDCLTNNYAISFFPVRSWAIGLTRAAMRGKKFKQEGAAFLYIESVAGQTNDIVQAKKWAELWGIPVFFGTIDSEIPSDWIQ